MKNFIFLSALCLSLSSFAASCPESQAKEDTVQEKGQKVAEQQNARPKYQHVDLSEYAIDGRIR